MDGEQIEFLAKQELITIEPSFNDSKYELVCGDFGPFEAGVAIDVPLWMALYLKQRHMCRVVAPLWLNVESLEQMIQEQSDSDALTPIPDSYMEMSRLLIQEAADDLNDTDRLKTLIKDLWDCRSAKLRSSVTKFVKEQQVTAQVKNITGKEVAYIRPLMTQALLDLEQLQHVSNFAHAS